MGVIKVTDHEFRMLPQREKIIKCIKSGYTYKQIQLECGSPGRKMIKQIIKEDLPELNHYLNDSKVIEAIRKKQINNYSNGSEG